MTGKFFPALAVLIGTTIGAGFLGIPYVISRAGFLPGLAYLVFVAILMFFMKLYLGEISLRTTGNHQLTGYASIYLGKFGKSLMFFAMIFGIYSALVAYLLAEGLSVSYLIFGVENFSFYFSLAFWLVLTCLSYIGLKALKKYEKFGFFFIMAIVLVISALFIGKVKIDNLSYINPENIFKPFGVILFSFLAFSAMPEVERILKGQEKFMKRVITLGVVIPLVVYLVFALVIVGNYGMDTNEIATLSLPRIFSLLGILTMFTAYFTLTIAIRDMFRFDYNLGRFKGWLLATTVPLALFLLISFFKIAGFISLLSLSGAVSAGMTGILILLMNKKAKEIGNRNPEYSLNINWLIIFIISLVFILAAVAEFLIKI